MEIHQECDLFILQINAFLDNYFDVGQLLEDSETKQQAISKVAELEEQLSIVSRWNFHVNFQRELKYSKANERLQDTDHGNSSKLGKFSSKTISINFFFTSRPI